MANSPDNPARPATSEDGSRLKAIGLMLTALVLFSALDTTGKYLAGAAGLPVTQISWLRFLGQFTLLLILVPAFGLLTPRQLFSSTRPGAQLFRSCLMAATTFFNFLALKYLRLDQTITIVFLTPLVVALLAGPLLGEWVGWRRMVAILVGFLGVLIAVRPGVAVVHPAVLYSVTSMLAYAFFMLVTRRIAAHDPPLVTLFWSMFVGTFLGAPFAYAHWVMPDSAAQWLMLFSLGILGGTGHYLFILAYRMAPASTVSPFLYLQLLTMVGFGWLVFGDLPDLFTIAGAVIVVSSGVYLIHRERIITRPGGGSG